MHLLPLCRFPGTIMHGGAGPAIGIARRAAPRFRARAGLSGLAGEAPTALSCTPQIRRRTQRVQRLSVPNLQGRAMTTALTYPPRTLGPEQEAMRAEVRAFLQKDYAAGGFGRGQEAMARYDVDFSRRWGQAGFIGITWPK
ncbi:MAG: hypothetical protein EBY18_23730, partial [Alphaproteobacteria bacterium]|nr:hypothetical protein [Alphaproteobacteria bacterium]